MRQSLYPLLVALLWSLVLWLLLIGAGVLLWRSLP
jgi:hypothetical protein